jgi:hypothetical protein
VGGYVIRKGGEEECVQNFGSKFWSEENTWKT